MESRATRFSWKDSSMRLHLCVGLLLAIVLLLARRRPLLWKGFWWGYGLLVGLAAGCSLALSEPNDWCHDFTRAYYPAGKLIWHGSAAYTETDLFVNLPLLAVPFTPF